MENKLLKSTVIDEIILKNSIRLLIGGYLYDGGDIEIIPAILQKIVNDYRDTIQKLKEVKNRP